MFKTFYLFFLLITVSCASKSNGIKVKKIEISPGHEFVIDYLVDHFTLDKPVVKLINFKKDSELRTAQVIMKRVSNSLVVSVLSLSGIELITLKIQNGLLVKIAGPMKVDLTFFKRVIADIMLIEMTPRDLKKILPEGIFVKYAQSVKEIFINNKKHIKIKYNANKIEYRHIVLGYSLDIVSIAVNE